MDWLIGDGFVVFGRLTGDGFVVFGRLSGDGFVVFGDRFAVTGDGFMNSSRGRFVFNSTVDAIFNVLESNSVPF